MWEELRGNPARAISDGTCRASDRQGGAGDRVDVFANFERVANALADKLGSECRRVYLKPPIRLMLLNHDDTRQDRLGVHPD